MIIIGTLTTKITFILPPAAYSTMMSVLLVNTCIGTNLWKLRVALIIQRRLKILKASRTDEWQGRDLFLETYMANKY